MEEKSFPIIQGLDALDKVFNQQQLDYRVVGSLLIAALNGAPHRRIGDIDIVIDEKDLKAALNGLINENYQLSERKIFGFKVVEAKNPEKLGFTFLITGKSTNDYFSYKPFRWLELRISNQYLQPTPYLLFGIKFIGIPPASVLEGIRVSNLNPKRNFDKKVLTEKLTQNTLKGETLEKAFRVFLFGTKIPFLYLIFSYIYNLFGGLRVTLGKKYEIWD